MNKGCLFYFILGVLVIVLGATCSSTEDGMFVALWGLAISQIVFWIVIAVSVAVGLFRMMIGK